MFPVFSQAKTAAKKTKSIQNLKYLSTGMIIYTSENNDRFPISASWEQEVKRFVTKPDAFDPILGEPGEGVKFMMNVELSNYSMSALKSPSETALLFLGASTAHSPQGSISDVFDLNGKALIGNADASCRWMDVNEIPFRFQELPPDPSSIQ